MQKSEAFSILDPILLGGYTRYITDIRSKSPGLRFNRPTLRLCDFTMLVLRLLCLWNLWILTRGQTPNTTGKICQWGCWDEEDEACHPGLNEAREKLQDIQVVQLGCPAVNLFCQFFLPLEAAFFFEKRVCFLRGTPFP